MKTLLILAVMMVFAGFLLAADPPEENASPEVVAVDSSAADPASEIAEDTDQPETAVTESVEDASESEAITAESAEDTDQPETAVTESVEDASESVANNVQPDTIAVKSTPAKAKVEPAELSTELGGLDTLDIVPAEIFTQVGGGTRHVGLESSVFRREEPVVYASAERRDPFRALITDEKKEGEIETEYLRVEGAALKGVVWSDGQYLALLTDKDGKSFVLREGDLVYQGRVISVTQSKAIFEISDFGDYQQVTLKVRG